MSKFTTTRTPMNRCLVCGYEIDAASPTPDSSGSSTPEPGDIALCLKCAHVHIFADDLTLRAPTGDEMVEIAGDRDMVRAIEAIGAYNRTHS